MLETQDSAEKADAVEPGSMLLLPHGDSHKDYYNKNLKYFLVLPYTNTTR